MKAPSTDKAPAKKPAAKKVPANVVLGLLASAERSGLSMGGLFLLALGMYGGQYAKLFPDELQNAAGSFCLFVSACGLGAVLYQLFLGWRMNQAQPE